MKGEFRKAVEPVFKKLYQRVKKGEEARIVLKANSRTDYKQGLAKELAVMRQSEMWRTGETVRSLRPGKWKKKK